MRARDIDRSFYVLHESLPPPPSWLATPQLYGNPARHGKGRPPRRRAGPVWVVFRRPLFGRLDHGAGRVQRVGQVLQDIVDMLDADDSRT